jgi:hypothetical protein
MRRWLAWVGVACLAAGPAGAGEFAGGNVGFAQAIGRSADFASDGTMVELRWRHQNRGRSAWELYLGYAQLGLDGEVQQTIAEFKATVEEKNQLAQYQGGPGEGYLVAEHGTFESFFFGANLLVHPWKRGRVSPYFSFGGGAYNWRLPFRVKFRRVPFFGEQHAYDPAANGEYYAGVVPEEVVDFTKHQTSGGLNVGVGSGLRLTQHLQLGAAARIVLIFSSGRGNREEGIDDQDYLNDITMAFLDAGLSYRF